MPPYICRWVCPPSIWKALKSSLRRPARFCTSCAMPLPFPTKWCFRWMRCAAFCGGARRILSPLPTRLMLPRCWPFARARSCSGRCASPLCRCGRRGCLETKVSWQALCRTAPFLPERFGEAYRRAKAQGTAGTFDDAIDLFARTIVNSATILAPNRVILFGPMFRDALIRQKLTQACCAYDAQFDARRILYSTLAKKEETVGPAAVFARSIL